MRLFCMDLHISVIADFKTACPDVEVVDWCLSGHAWVMKRNQEYPDHINPRTWRDLTPERMQAFRDKYDAFLQTFDGFIVGFCSAFAMIYEPYNKPILMLNAVRYDIPFCWTRNMEMRLKWNECLDRLNSHGLLTIVSNNKADQLYTKLGCGLTSRYVPSLCLYTKTTYAPTKPTFLCVGGSFSHPLITQKSELPPRHEWSDITAFRGLINLPYEVSLMSAFEHFTAGCPLFFPSKACPRIGPRRFRPSLHPSPLQRIGSSLQTCTSVSPRRTRTTSILPSISTSSWRRLSMWTIGSSVGPISIGSRPSGDAFSRRSSRVGSGRRLPAISATTVFPSLRMLSLMSTTPEAMSLPSIPIPTGPRCLVGMLSS